MSESSSRVRFELIKSPSFRVVHADGVFGGLTPSGKIFLGIYNERFPIPTATVHEIGPDGKVGDEMRSERESRNAILREIDVGVEMDLDVARATREWLDDKIKDLESRKKDVQK